MNVLLMLIGVLIVYLAIKLVFRYNWNKGLGVALEFEKKHVVTVSYTHLTLPTNREV